MFNQTIAIFIILLLWRITEFFTVTEAVIPDETNFLSFISALVQNEAAATLLYCISFGLIVSAIRLFSRKIAVIVYSVFLIILLLIYLASTQFFYTTQLLLDKVVFFFSWDELTIIMNSETGTVLSTYFWFYAICIALLLIFIIPGFRQKKDRATSGLGKGRIVAVSLIGLIALSFYLFPVKGENPRGESIARSKTAYFLQSVYSTLIPEKQRNMGFDRVVKEYRQFNHLKDITAQDEYPLMHIFDPKTNNLSKYFEPFDGPPNIVMVFCEGLSSSFSGPDAAYGNMTPNLDSLYSKGLFWPNALSNTDRTHGVFANALASTPHGFERGILNLHVEKYPEMFSLPKYLVGGGYDAAFLYGGWAYFDNYEPFMRKNYVDKIYGKSFFEKNYGAKAFHHGNDHSWGIADKPFFKLFFKLEDKDRPQTPYLNVFLNQSLHPPFLIPNQEEYIEQARKNYQKTKGDPEFFEKYKNKWSIICYMDQAIGDFMHAYKKRPEYENTIFIFVGDHNFFGFPLLNGLDSHNVPLVIYSPKLKAPHTFKDIVAQTDIAPSLVKLVKPYLPDAKYPLYSNWMSTGLSTTNKPEATKPIFIGTYSGPIQGVVRSDTLYLKGRLYKIGSNMTLDQIDDKSAETAYKHALEDYRAINKYVIEKNKLIRDPAGLFPNHPGALWFGK